MIAPTTAMAEMALVSDISGVCSSRDTRRITPRPMNVASTKTKSWHQKSAAGAAAAASVGGHARLLGERLAGPRVPDLALVGDERALLDVVVQVELEGAVLGERLQEGGEVAREEQARVERHRGRQVERRHDRDAATRTVSPGRDSSQLPPPSAARSTITAPGFIDRTMSAVTSLGANTPPMSAVVTTTSDWAHLRGEDLALARLVLLGQLLGVAAARRRRSRLSSMPDVLAADALDLLLHLGPDVGGDDVGAEPLGGGDGLQAGDRRRRSRTPWPAAPCRRPS